jgi:hypothetical protein
MIRSRDELSARYRVLHARTREAVVDHPLYFSRQDDGMAHLEFHGDGSVSSIVTEHGATIASSRFEDEEDLLYHLVRGAIWMMACEYEKSHRVEGQDLRRVLFARDLELMNRVSPEWGERRRAEIDDLLRRYPFCDRPEPPADAVNRPEKIRSSFQIAFLRSLLALGVLLLLALLHLPLLLKTLRQETLRKEGIRVEATVVERSIVENRFVDLYRVTYRFEAGGESIERAESVGQAIHDRVREGSRIDVLHLPADPRKAMIDENDEASRLAWIWGMIDVLLVIAAWRIRASVKKQT